MACLSQIIRLEKVAEEMEKGRNNCRLSYLSLDDKKHESASSSLDEKEFLKAAKSQPKQLFEMMYHRQTQLFQTLSDNEKEYDVLLDDYNKLVEEDNALKDQHAVLQVEVDGLKQAYQELAADRDMYMTAFARLQIQAQAPVPVRSGRESVEVPGAIPVDRPSKSTKLLPKGAKLSDGIDPTFDSWLIDMRHSLSTNKDHYDTSETRMALVKRMCEGRAARHLLPRMREDSPNPFFDVEDMFDHLKTLFQDVNRVAKAKDKTLFSPDEEGHSIPRFSCRIY
jgi:cell division protein FtsL